MSTMFVLRGADLMSTTAYPGPSRLAELGARHRRQRHRGGHDDRRRLARTGHGVSGRHAGSLV
ncbi:hypothetical protein [Nocardioides convexus]|uniref:hypothetical protein n=1 Tax=Nocardioides convexus TaxID=2712224 RepID=UPI002418650F|nr:hypothetical protein [Nocardioides convexus]